MKKIISLSVFAFVLGFFYEAMAEEIKLGPLFQWSATEFDFGKISQNQPATHRFTFVNTGEEPLLISEVKASCGCTVTDYSKDPIPPGQTGYVSATYNAAKLGGFIKSVSVQSNTPEGLVQLTIRGEVVE